MGRHGTGMRHFAVHSRSSLENLITGFRGFIPSPEGRENSAAGALRPGSEWILGGTGCRTGGVTCGGPPGCSRRSLWPSRPVLPATGRGQGARNDTGLRGIPPAIRQGPGMMLPGVWIPAPRAEAGRGAPAPPRNGRPGFDAPGRRPAPG